MVLPNLSFDLDIKSDMYKSRFSDLSKYVYHMSSCLFNLKEISGLKYLMFSCDTAILPEAEL